MKCRSCNMTEKDIFLDLGNQPPANNYLSKQEDVKIEKKIPLQIFFCKNCFLVQTKDYVTPSKLFSKDYAYLSSVSSSWVEHAIKLKEDLITKFEISKNDIILEIASNDGYLLENFVKDGFHRCIGIEPTQVAAKIAKEKKIKVIEKFFSFQLSKTLKKEKQIPKLIIANNVIAHVNKLNDFIKGIKNILDKDGIVSIEFAHLLKLIKFKQFDTIYHEHFSYISLIALKKIFKKHSLRIFDVKELETHGGSLRIFGCHSKSKYVEKNSVKKIMELEYSNNLHKYYTYKKFSNDIQKIKHEFLEFMNFVKKKNLKIVAFGAAAKGNTFLNYCGITANEILFVVDNAFTKQNKFLPGSSIPIVDKKSLLEIKPNYVLVLPWNLYDEISQQLEFVKDWGCQLIRAIPKLNIKMK